MAPLIVDTAEVLGELLELLERLPPLTLLAAVLLRPGHGLGRLPPGVHEDLV